MVDIGDSERQSDGSVYNNYSLGYAVENNRLIIPNPELFNNYGKTSPYVLIADYAFALKKYTMKTYPNKNVPLHQRIFNYRHSMAKRIMENMFCIATARFRIFRSPFIANVKTVILVTKAIVALHNYLMIKRSQNIYNYCPRN